MLFFKRFKKTPIKQEKEEDIVENLQNFVKERCETSQAWQTLKDKNPRLYENLTGILTGSFD